MKKIIQRGLIFLAGTSFILWGIFFLPINQNLKGGVIIRIFIALIGCSCLCRFGYTWLKSSHLLKQPEKIRLPHAFSKPFSVEFVLKHLPD
ncbi:MAG: hypothetical protein P4L62_04455 [Candidatus Pacebacteria bacterium]|nr:hypothetical protein [Candidatus Paceibacterota bacterium]MDR3583583.1 hypothetical protein [Candidatus Paceibacterota bacterium]